MMEPILMDYVEAYNLLKKNGINAAEARYVKTYEEAVDFADGKAIVIKGISAKALHKTKSGLVATNLLEEKDIKEAFISIQKRAEQYKPYRILAQRMVPYNPNNIEIIIGSSTDQQFGKLLLLGLGGIYVEAFRDFAIRLCPITRHDAEAMLDDLKSSKIIAKTDKDRKTIVDLLLKSAVLAEDKKIKEFDLNPIIFYDGKYTAVDLRILKG